MIPLRSKIILSLIFMSFISMVLMATSARMLISQHFEELAVDPVADNFIIEVAAYYNEYGSWQAALEAETLVNFGRRLRAAGELLPARSPMGNRSEPTPNGQPAPPPPPYIILDEGGRVVISPDRTEMGRILSTDQLEKAIPVLDKNGQLIGYLYSELRAALSAQEDKYLLAINDSWWIALLAVAALSIPTGVFLGRQLAGPIGSLEKAMRAMQPGSMQQKVPVTSNDELGRLTASFNQMSRDLSDAYDELEKSRIHLQEMSLQDPLTLLPNRRSFDVSAAIVIAQAYRHGRTCALAMIDVDRFKEINDTYSHAKGDLALQLLSNVLRSNLREVDFLARYGGEEFMVLFPETDLATAHNLMDRLRIFVSEHSWPDIDPGVRITVSAGLVEVNVNEMSAEPLKKAISAADKKLYTAKNGGRNRVES